MLKNQQTYEIMRPEAVGQTASRLVLGKHSGRHALAARLVELGYNLETAELALAFEQFKKLADKKKRVTDADLEALVSDQVIRQDDLYALDGLQVSCGTMGMPTATARLRAPDGCLHTFASMGSGPVDATYKAINAIVRAPSTLLEFNVHAVTEGIDAIGQVTVRIQGKEGGRSIDAQSEMERPRTFGGYGADTDIIVAAAKAYLNALNKLVAAGQLRIQDTEQATETALATVHETTTAPNPV
jgi:2-isopropylmalate synthase